MKSEFSDVGVDTRAVFAVSAAVFFDSESSLLPEIEDTQHLFVFSFIFIDSLMGSS